MRTYLLREKRMKKIIATAIATITAALLLCFSVSAFDNNDYGGGGGYDYGGGDYGGYGYGERNAKGGRSSRRHTEEANGRKEN